VADWCRLDINNPPTAVGGIRRGTVADWCRLDINNPPTAVGGIQEVALSCFLWAGRKRTAGCRRWDSIGAAHRAAEPKRQL
jgi:hypothetical protein